MPKITQAGTYAARVRATALGESKEKRAMQIIVTFADAVNGDTITAYLATSEKAWPYTEEKLRAMGWDPAQNGYRFEELNSDPSPITGNDVEIVCDFEEYNGKPDLRVKFINVPGGGFKRMEEGEALTFADRLRKQLGVSGSSSSARRAGPPRTNSQRQPEQGDDEVPF